MPASASSLSAKRLGRELGSFMHAMEPFAFVTFELSPGRRHLPSRRAILTHFAPFLRSWTLRVDQDFHRTHHVVKRVPKARRLDGICVPEGLNTPNPHIHAALFAEEYLAEAEREDRLCQLLQKAFTGGMNLLPEDEALMSRRGLIPNDPRFPNITKAVSPAAVCHVRSIDDAYRMAGYQTKKVRACDIAEQTDFILLSSFWSTSGQHPRAGA